MPREEENGSIPTSGTTHHESEDNWHTPDALSDRRGLKATRCHETNLLEPPVEGAT
jgi:hypothetical protein